jgi:hypothetical protein
MDPGFTLVNLKEPLDVCTVHLDNEVEVLPGSNLLAIELTDSGGPTFIKGTLQTEDSSASEDGIELSDSSCKISKVHCWYLSKFSVWLLVYYYMH